MLGSFCPFTRLADFFRRRFFRCVTNFFGSMCVPTLKFALAIVQLALDVGPYGMDRERLVPRKETLDARRVSAAVLARSDPSSSPNEWRQVRRLKSALLPQHARPQIRCLA
jgi:hypothetical protein